MQRRKFIVGLASLTAGASAAVGTGAFSNATIPDRAVTVNVETDDNATIALVPGADPDISLVNGQLAMDLTGSNGEGVNINSLYTWGDHTDPANDYAFKIVNNDESEYDDVVFKYELDDDSWVDNATTYDNESFIKFSVYSPPQPNGYWGFMKCPNNQLATPNPVSRNMPTSGPVDFTPGQVLYVVIDVDTTGVDATVADDLSGKLSIEVSGIGGN
ncbi:hypothetical protein [Haloferax sp. DFSO52]|uniref:hypothetical protein n=1 Tax=Haloferax sp. DFSO52 TaxID=3388505 RepID=UPI003A8B3AD8